MTKAILYPLALAGILISSPVTLENQKICTSRDMLYSAIQSAAEGDVIYVGDVDFTPDGNVFNSVMRLSLDKGITLKSGKKNENAVFTNGSFNIKGTKISGDILNVKFENITFDGNIDGASLTDQDWEYADPEDLEPRKCQYAMNFVGNVSASYKNCSFTNYMNEYGGAFWARYGDYSGDLEEWFGNYSTCSLNIEMDGCSVEKNYAMYGGGAFYFEGNQKNISFTARNTSFKGNKSGCTNFSEGGGAFRLNSVSAEFQNCLFDENEGSYSYGSTPRTGVDPEEYGWYPDRTVGGAIRTEASDLKAVECVFTKNMACCGGALHLGTSTAEIDGCVFTQNKANSRLLMESDEDKGPWSNMGMGGAIYIDSWSKLPVDIYNSSFYQNEARNAYGGIYGYYLAGASELQPDVFPVVNVYFSSFYDNKTLVSYEGEAAYPWADQPGDVYSIPYFTFDSCFIIDETLKSLFPKHEMPSEKNGYCYYGSMEDMTSDSISVSYYEESKQMKLTFGGTSLEVPKEHAEELLKERYEGKEPEVHTVGSNYSYEYFHNVPTPVKTIQPVYIILPAFVLLALGLVVGIWFLEKRRGNASKEAVEPKEEALVLSEAEVDTAMQEADALESLTSREKEILEGILKGKKRKEIADELFVSEATVKKYTTSLYKKLGVSTRYELYAKMSKK